MTKPAKTYQEQLNTLKSRGLAVSDEPFAIHCLKHHNYYRISAYRFPFTVSGKLHGVGRERKLYNSLVLLIHLMQVINRPPTGRSVCSA